MNHLMKTTNYETTYTLTYNNGNLSTMTGIEMSKGRLVKVTEDSKNENLKAVLLEILIFIYFS